MAALLWAFTLSTLPVIVGHDLAVVLVGLPVVCVDTTLVLSVNAINLAVVRVDLTLRICLNLPLSGPHLRLSPPLRGP